MKISIQIILLLLLAMPALVYSQVRDNADKLFEQYEIIDDPDAERFVQDTLAHAIGLYGTPRIPVSRVVLRYRPQRAFVHITDAKKGIFTIFVSHREDEYLFYSQLAHEVAHLLNAQVFDVYIEGINGLFAREVLRRKGIDWSPFEDFYCKNDNTFYAATYLMMKDVLEVAGEDALRNIFSYARHEKKNHLRMYIDINAWINSLPVEKRPKVKNTILKHAQKVENAMCTAPQVNNFILPE